VVAALALPLSPAALHAETDLELARRWGEAALMPGAARLLRHLHAHGVPLALATSTPRSVLALKRESLGDLYGLFAAVVAGDDVSLGKPHPEAYLAAAAALGMPAHECLAIEDAPSGVASARAAGCAVLAVPSAPERAACGGARTTLLCSLLDVKPCAWALPPLHDWVARALPLQPLLRLKGPVVRGFGRGSKLLGIPTANLDADALGPAVAHAAVSGIYVAWASVGPAPAAIHKAVLSIGWCAQSASRPAALTQMQTQMQTKCKRNRNRSRRCAAYTHM
jgi:riboflavin kinase